MKTFIPTDYEECQASQLIQRIENIGLPNVRQGALVFGAYVILRNAVDCYKYRVPCQYRILQFELALRVAENYKGG